MNDIRDQIWLGVDVGINNLALVKALINISNNSCKVLDATCVDLTIMKHKRVPKCNCILYHSNDAYDRVQHMLQEMGPEWFEPAARILIERQPITGLVHIEQLLYGEFRNRASLISPNKMHTWLGISHLPYEQRKEKTVEMATPYLNDMDKSHVWNMRERKHDMADALCLILFELHVTYNEYKKKNNSNTECCYLNQTIQISDNMNLDEYFKQFQFSETIKADDFMKIK